MACLLEQVIVSKHLLLLTMKIFITILICFASLLGRAQTNFYKQFSGDGYDYAYGVIELPDSSYMITGSSSSFTEGPSQMFLLHIDSLGNFIRSSSYGQDGSDVGQRVKQLSTGEFFVGGYTNSAGAGAYDMALWKIAEDGALIWFKTFGTAAWEKINDMVLTEDDGLIIIGETDNTTDGHTDVIVLRVDQDGIIVWEKQYENPGDDSAFTIEQIATSTYAIGGKKYNNTTNLNQGWLLKIDGNGNDIWTRTIGSTKNYSIQDLIVTGTKIYCAGYTTPNVMDSSFVFTVIYEESDGSMLVEYHDQNIGLAGVHLANFEYVDAVALGVSTVGPNTFGLEDNLFFGFTILGYYYKTIGTVQYASSQVIGDMHTTYNKGVISVGYNRHIGPGGSSIYVFRAGNGQPLLHANDDMSPAPIVSIYEASELTNLEVYPNPTTGILKLQYEGNSQLEIKIVDLVGNIIKDYATISSKEIDLSELSSGIYYLQFKDVNSQSTSIQKIQLIK